MRTFLEKLRQTILTPLFNLKLEEKNILIKNIIFMKNPGMEFFVLVENKIFPRRWKISNGRFFIKFVN